MNKILKYFAVGALAVGLIFGKYIGRWIVNLIDNPDTRVNIGKPFVLTYLNQCDTMHLVMRNFTTKLKDFKVRGGFDISNADNTAYLDKQTTGFFDKKRGKYFCIYYFFPNNSISSQMYETFLSDIDQSGAIIIAYVNRVELGDNTYGTKLKPIPIVYYDVPAKMNSFYNLVADEGKSNYSNENEFKSYMCVFFICNFIFIVWKNILS
ncbi:MAG: hypothetical protein ABWZ79_06480 [Pedobacter agri]